MKYNILRIILAASLCAVSSTAISGGEPPSTEELWRMIQQQQAEIDALKRQLSATDDKAEAAVAAQESAPSNYSAASWADRTHVSGYGELHYNILNGKGGASDKEEIDLHRFVLEIGHEFNERIRLFTELEVEHSISGDGESGEVEVEQAYVEFDINDRMSVKGGLFLLPVGILNETHEPTTFYGVERNPVEKDIVPSTWWAGGASLSTEIAPGLRFDIALHEGLKTSAGSSYKPRSGRQKTSKSDASDLAATARIKWTGYRGVELAGTFQHQNDITQGADPTAGDASLVELHGVYNRGPFSLRALYARWDLEGSGPESIGADEQTGFYVEPAWRLSDTLGVFARFNQWDNAAGSSSDSEKQQIDVGVNWWPHEDVVVKVDYQDQNNENNSDRDGVNLGIGYQF